jgi:hypothetical protein
MRVLVDTSIWSLSLRKKTKTDEEKGLAEELSELIREMRVEIIGPIRQEILSGIKDESRFEDLKTRLEGFEDIQLETKHYVEAAKSCNKCRRKGIQGSHIDFLICAVALLEGCSIFTSDNDFVQYARELRFQLHEKRRISKDRNGI